MSNFSSTIGQKVGGQALPPTRSDLDDWKKNRWWWEREAPGLVFEYDEAAKKKAATTRQNERPAPLEDNTLT